SHAEQRGRGAVANLGGAERGRGVRHGELLSMRAGLVAACMSLGCSLTYGELPAEQCRSDADCAALGLAGAVCDAGHGVCVEPGADLESGDTAGDGAARLAA